MSVAGRVEKLERVCGRVPGPCPVCERRAESSAPAALPGNCREELIDTVQMNCWRCGRPVQLNIVCVERVWPDDEPASQG